MSIVVEGACVVSPGAMVDTATDDGGGVNAPKSTPLRSTVVVVVLVGTGTVVTAVGPVATLVTGRATVVVVEVVVDAYQAHMLDEHERMAARERAFFEHRLAAPSQNATSNNTRIPF